MVPERCLRPDRDDARADRAIAAHDPAAFLRLIEQLVIGAGNSGSPRCGRACDIDCPLGTIVRGIVRSGWQNYASKQPRHALLEVRKEFRDVLYAHPEAGGYPARDFDGLFSAAFAQTLAFGFCWCAMGRAKPSAGRLGAHAGRTSADEDGAARIQPGRSGPGRWDRLRRHVGHC